MKVPFAIQSGFKGSKSYNSAITNEDGAQFGSATSHSIPYRCKRFSNSAMMKALFEHLNALYGDRIDIVPHGLDIIVVYLDTEDWPVGRSNGMTEDMSAIGEVQGIQLAEKATVENPSYSNLGNQISLSKLSNTISKITRLSKIYGMASDSETTEEHGAVWFQNLQTVASMELKNMHRRKNHMKESRPSFEDDTKWYHDQEFSREFSMTQETFKSLVELVSHDISRNVKMAERGAFKR